MKESVIVEKINKYGAAQEVFLEDYNLYKDEIEKDVYAQLGMNVFKKLEENPNYVVSLDREWKDTTHPASGKELRAIATIWKLTTIKTTE